MGRKPSDVKSAPDPATMTDDELIAFHAAEKARFAAELRANLTRYGTTLGPTVAPPSNSASGVSVVPSRAKTVKFEIARLNGKVLESNPKWKDVRKTCPHCGKTKSVIPDFGILVRRDWEYAASWCRDCRGKTDYRKEERRYKTKNGEPGEKRK